MLRYLGWATLDLKSIRLAAELRGCRDLLLRSKFQEDLPQQQHAHTPQRFLQQADAAALGAVLTKSQTEAVLRHFQNEVS